MYIKLFYWTLIMILVPVLGIYADLELSFSDTTPPSPLTVDILPVGGTFTIDVIASAPIGTIAAVDFDVTWTPDDNVDYLDVFAGGFLPGAIVIGADADTPGTQTVAVAASGGANKVGSGVLVTLSFEKEVGEGTVRFGFSNISALNLSFQPVTSITWTPSSDITLPVVFSSVSWELGEAGVTIRWHTRHEIDNAGFNVLRSMSEDGIYAKLNLRLIEGQGTSAVPHEYQYIDSAVTSGNTYYYKLEALDLMGDKSYSKVIKLEVTGDDLNPPDRSQLGQNYPNPSNPDTWIPYVLSSDGEVTIEIYNMAGQLIRKLDLGNRGPGKYISKDRAAYWDGIGSSGEEVPSGVYFYIIKAGSFTMTRKLFMLR